MSGLIGGYRPLTPLRTVGSGSARWCIAARGLEKYFLKQFLSPVYPADPSTPLGQRQRELQPTPREPALKRKRKGEILPN